MAGLMAPDGGLRQARQAAGSRCIMQRPRAVWPVHVSPSLASPSGPSSKQAPRPRLPGLLLASVTSGVVAVSRHRRAGVRCKASEVSDSEAVWGRRARVSDDAALQQPPGAELLNDEPDVLPEEWEQQRQLWDEMWSEDGDEAGLEDPQEVVRKKRVMLLISDTGGGHRASAKALADALEELYPEQLTITIRDVFSESCPWPFNSVVQQYMWMAKHTWAWKWTWTWSRFPFTRWLAQTFANVRCKRAFCNAIEQDDPDLIISVHPGTQHLVMKVLKMKRMRLSRGERIPFVTVVTDLGSAHPMWFHPEADRIFVPSEQVRRLALRCGVRESAIQMYGLPLRRAFWRPEPRPRSAVREALGLVQEAPAVLIVGGGDGVGRIPQVAEAMGKELGLIAGGAQLVVICGKNEKVRRQLLSVQWPPGVSAHIVGFVSNIDEYMAASDVIVTKAGPGTIAEACTRALPVMLSSFLPGQERGNVTFVVKGGFGEFSTKPEVIAQTVAAWLKDPSELERRSKLSLSYGRPNATLQIARVIGSMWLKTDTGKLASALKSQLNRSTKEIAEKAAGPSVNTKELKESYKQLVEAQHVLKEAERALSDAKARVRTALGADLPPEEQ